MSTARSLARDMIELMAVHAASMLHDIASTFPIDYCSELH